MREASACDARHAAQKYLLKVAMRTSLGSRPLSASVLKSSSTLPLRHRSLYKVEPTRRFTHMLKTRNTRSAYPA